MSVLANPGNLLNPSNPLNLSNPFKPAERPRGGEGQRDEDQEQHQEFGIPEVVLEHPGGEHRHDG